MNSFWSNRWALGFPLLAPRPLLLQRSNAYLSSLTGEAEAPVLLQGTLNPSLNRTKP